MDSIDQIIFYLSRVAKEPISVNMKRISDRVVKVVKISSRFFVEDSCQMCGRCCSNYNVAYTKSHFEKILFATEDDFKSEGLDYSVKLDLITGVKKIERNVNGRNITFFSQPKSGRNERNILEIEQGNPKPYCKFEVEREGKFICSVHPVRSITCRIPHMRFMYNQKNNHTVLTVGKYPRNFKLHCPTQFKLKMSEESIRNRIDNLKLLNVCAEDIEVETYLPEIISYLEQGGREPREFTEKVRGRLFSLK